MLCRTGDRLPAAEEGAFVWRNGVNRREYVGFWEQDQHLLQHAFTTDVRREPIVYQPDAGTLHACASKINIPSPSASPLGALMLGRHRTRARSISILTSSRLRLPRNSTGALSSAANLFKAGASGPVPMMTSCASRTTCSRS